MCEARRSEASSIGSNEHTDRSVRLTLVGHRLIGWLKMRFQFYFTLTLPAYKLNKMDKLNTIAMDDMASP